MRIHFFVVMLVVCAAAMSCTSDAAPAVPISHRVTNDRGQTQRVRAAADLTSLYAGSQFESWDVHADAAGALCNVLLIRTPVVMESSMVDAMHRGSGEYEVDGGGVQSFYLEQTFRGVAYTDGSGRVWTYGAVREAEVEELEPCR
ncbi:MAG TPA: hypothetical protein VJ276_13910 [Thermoanaerobaculia bacterium]|nr:hypothetical protein [Thermoanaerobaculia bacterium]